MSHLPANQLPIRLTPEQIAVAKKVRDVLVAALEAIDSRRVPADELALPSSLVWDLNTMLPPPSARVQAIIDEAAAARAAVEQETSISRAAAIAVQIASSIAKLLLPFAAALLVVLAMILPGCVQPDAVRVDAPIRAASPATVTSQPTESSAVQRAGHDARQTPITISASGSAWPVVAVLAMAGALVLTVSWMAGRLRRIKVPARAMAESIVALGAGEQRDRLLSLIRASMCQWDRRAWLRMLERWDLRVHRREGLHPPSGGTNVKGRAPTNEPPVGI